MIVHIQKFFIFFTDVEKGQVVMLYNNNLILLSGNSSSSITFNFSNGGLFLSSSVLISIAPY